MPRDTMHRPAQDIPFWPDYINRELGGSFNWCLAHRLTDNMRANGHEIAIHPKRYKEMERRHAEEVRAAVRLQMAEITGCPAMVDALLALPGLRIETESREWPGSELERRHVARAAEHAAQVAARESLNNRCGVQ